MKTIAELQEDLQTALDVNVRLFGENERLKRQLNLVMPERDMLAAKVARLERGNNEVQIA